MLKINWFCRFLCLGFLLLATITNAQTAGCGRLYVDSAVTTSGNGSSWATAFKTVSQALDSANSGTCSSREIWVRKGTYYPMAGLTTIASSSDSSFRILRNGIKLYGGFAGTETVLSARSVAMNPTILSGSLGGNGNSYHVITVVSNNTIDNSTCIDGFIVKEGNASDDIGAILIAGQTIYRNSGGGVINFKSSPIITHCTFSYNYAKAGGGIVNLQSSPVISNCVFTDNTSNNGGAINNGSASPTSIINCIFYQNNGVVGGAIINGNPLLSIVSCTFFNNISAYGGGIYNTGSSPSISNCIFWGNSANSGNDFYNSPGSSLNINYCNTQTSQTGTGNSTADPLFVNSGNPVGSDGIWGTADDGLLITPCSPAINTGNNAALPAGTTTDIRDTVRIQNTTVDKGAYETIYNAISGSVTTVVASVANPVCSTTSITFTATTVVPGTVPAYQWYKNGVAVAGATTTTYTANSWSANGDSVWVVHTNNNCNVTDTSNKSYVQLPPVPAQPGTISGNANPCPGSQTYSVSPVTGAASYTWTVPAGWTITGGQGTTSVTATSTSAAGSVTVTANNSCGVASAVRTFTATPLTSPAVPGGPVSVCASSAGNGYSVPAVAGATTYTWTVPAGWAITAGQGTTAITVTAAAGNTSGSVSVSAGNSCQTSGSTALAVTGSNAVPSVSIGSSSAGSSICAGTVVTFTATAVNGGSAPAYQWKKNGANVGTNSAAYTDNTLATGDAVTVTLTSNAACVSTSSATATAAAITVVPVVTPAISIAGSQNITLCTGASATFAATGTGGGTSPTYQWYKNGVAIAGATTSSYTSSGFSNNDSLSVLLTSSAACRTADTVRSGSVKLTVNPYSTPTLIVGSNSGNTVCAGTLVTFTAAPFNGGPSPAYEWKKNGVVVGTNSALYSTSALATGDLVTVTLTSNSPCATVPTVTASGPPITVVTGGAPGVSIAGSQNISLCAGASATFTAVSTNGGTAPTYQWYKNGSAVAGATGATYTGSGFSNGDSVLVRLTSNAVCRTVDTARSSSVKLTVNPNVVPLLTVSAVPGTSVPPGTAVTFTANLTVTGPNATYQWYKNGNAIAGATGSTYTTNGLQGGDLISVGVNALGPCASPSSLTSVALRISNPAGVQALSGAASWTESLLVHPNPSSGRFTVSVDWGLISAGERVQVEVVNSLGQVVWRNTAAAAAGRWSLEVELETGVSNGVYLLRVQRQSDGSQVAKSLLIQR